MVRFLLWLLLAVSACAPIKRQDTSGLNTVDLTALDLKVDAIWNTYLKARQLLVKKVVQENSELSRAEWEALLQSGPSLTGEELQTLSGLHRKLIASAQKLAKSESRLNIDQVRADGKVEQFCHEFPKGAMLHIHPWGTLDDPTVRQILAAVDPTVDFDLLKNELEKPGDSGTFFPQELTQLTQLSQKYQGKSKFSALAAQDQETLVRWFFLPDGPQDFSRFLGVFTIISKLVFSNKNVDPEPIMYEKFFDRAKKHNVQYIEISQFIKTFPSWVIGLESWAKKVRADHNIEVSLLAAFTRAKDPEVTRKLVDKLLKLPHSPRLTGVNFLADEGAHPAFEKGQTLYVPLLASAESGSSSLQRSIHSGELGDLRNSRDAIIMGAQRLGHGVKLNMDILTLEIARKQQIHIETNLISNVRLKVVPSVQDHPFLNYIRLGIPASWSTDDEGIFESTISDECIAAVKETDIQYSELASLSRNGLKGAFINDAVKTQMLKELSERFNTFEDKWKSYLVSGL